MSKLDFLPTLLLVGALTFGAAAHAATPQEQRTTLLDASVDCPLSSGEASGAATINPYGPYGYLFGLGLDRELTKDKPVDCVTGQGDADRL